MAEFNEILNIENGPCPGKFYGTSACEINFKYKVTRKKLLFMVTFVLTAEAFGFSFVPGRVVTPLLDIFNSENREDPEGM